LRYAQRWRPIGIVLVELVRKFNELLLRSTIFGADYGNFTH
jgi:hypothetical protein